MATPYQGQPQYGQPQQDPYDHNQQQTGGAASPVPQGATPVPAAQAKKKRAYAGQAYEFGGGANAQLGGQQVGGGQYPPPPQQNQGYGGHAQQAQGGYPGPQYGAGQASPAPGTPAFVQQDTHLGGYQSPEPGYTAQGAPPQHPSVAGITQGMGAMSVGQQGRLPMNQLYPTDIMNSPLNVSELDLPPPRIILPPNVSR